MEKSQTGCPPRWCIIANTLQHLHQQAASTPQYINITSYADYITLTTSHPQIEKLCDMIIPRELSTEKPSATVFTTWRKLVKFDPRLTINSSPKPVNSKTQSACCHFRWYAQFWRTCEEHQREMTKAQ